MEGNGQNQKRENMGKIPTLRETPPCGNTHVKKLRFILCFRALGAFLVFTKMLTFCDKVMWE